MPFSLTIVPVSPDVILCGWLGSKHQLTNHSPGELCLFHLPYFRWVVPFSLAVLFIYLSIYLFLQLGCPTGISSLGSSRSALSFHSPHSRWVLSFSLATLRMNSVLFSFHIPGELCPFLFSTFPVSFVLFSFQSPNELRPFPLPRSDSLRHELHVQHSDWALTSSRVKPWWSLSLSLSLCFSLSVSLSLPLFLLSPHPPIQSIPPAPIYRCKHWSDFPQNARWPSAALSHKRIVIGSFAKTTKGLPHLITILLATRDLRLGLAYVFNPTAINNSSAPFR